MLPEIEKLLILQDRDLKTRNLRNEVAKIPKERKALEEKLAGLQSQANDAKQRQRNAEVEQSRLDTEIKSRRDQIAKYEIQKLQTRKNEEYQALNHSIDHVRKEISGIEDRQIELMEQLEALKPEVAASEKAAQNAQNQIRVQIEDLETKNRNLSGQIEELEGVRSKYTEGLDEDLLETYQRLLTTRGTAVASVSHEVCNGCHMKLTTSTINETKVAKTVPHCDQCGRILYLE